MEWKQGAKNLTPYNAELINNEGREKLGHVQVAMQMSIWVIHCYPVLTDLRSAIIYLLYDLALASSINGLDSSSGRIRDGVKATSNHSKEEGYSFVE